MCSVYWYGMTLIGNVNWKKQGSEEGVECVTIYVEEKREQGQNMYLLLFVYKQDYSERTRKKLVTVVSGGTKVKGGDSYVDKGQRWEGGLLSFTLYLGRCQTP